MTGRSSQVARGLNTIAANIVKNQDALAAYGISVEDANGNLKSTYDVLAELKPKWDEMSDAEKVALGTTLAGKNQYKVLASVMQNFAHATDATATALNSSGSAAKENAKFLESIEARVNAVSAAFQQMAVAVVDSDLVKGILDLVKGFAEFGSTGVGSAITQFVLLSGLSWGGLQLLGQSILPGIINSFKTFSALVKGASLVELANGGSTLAVALGASLPVILAVVGGLTALVAIIKAIKSAYDEANPSVEVAAANFEQAQEALKSAQDNYQQTTDKLEELNATPFESRTEEIQAEIEKLELLQEYYEQLIEARKAEATVAASKYVKSVEKNGIAVGGYTATWQEAVNTGYKWYDPYGSQYTLQEHTESFKSYEAAVLAATNAVNKNRNAHIEYTTAVETAKILEEQYGVVIKENTISTEELHTRYKGLLQDYTYGEETTASLTEDYKQLNDVGLKYAESLRTMKENGVQLNDQQEEFLRTYDLVAQKYEERLELEAAAQGVTKETILAQYEAASALSEYAQQLINAANAYQIFQDRLAETGDYDDSFKGFSSILGEVISEFDAGQIGSQKFLTGLELLTGQTFTSAEAVEYMNNNLDTLNLLFGDAESGGTGLLTALEDIDGALSYEDGNLQITIDDFAGLADQLGISEGALYSLIEALRVMGVDFQYNVEDILSSIEGLGEGITTVQDGVTHIDFGQFVEQAQQLGLTNEEIKTYQSLLENAANTQLDNVDAGLSLLATSAEDGTEEVEGLDTALENVSNADVSGVAGSITAIGDAAVKSTTKVQGLADAIAGIGSVGFNAEGTSHAKAGPSLVNEEGPELIQSGDKAYVAGGGYPTVTQLREGDRVYTAEETKDILKGDKLPNPIQAHVKGTLTGGGGSSGLKKVTGTGIGGGTASITAAILAGLKGKGRTGDSGSGSSSSSSSSSSAPSAQDIKAEFDAWLKAKKHALAMDEITEEEYYRELEKMNDKYFKGKAEYQDEYWKYQEQIYSWEKKQEEEKAKAAEKAAEEARKAYENEFASWLKAQDHALAMDEITQEEYYEALEAMNDQYFKDKEEYQDKYWQYEEKIYAWRKRQAEEEAKAQEQALKDQIALEKKLNDLAKAQASRVKVFQDGQFRYVSDREALAKAQEALSGYASGTFSASGGLSLVGEHGAEMRVLNKGDGILPSNVTKNLWAWGSIDPSSFDGNGSDIYNFDISNLSLPDVQDANSFVNGLKSYALQYAMQRGK